RTLRHPGQPTNAQIPMITKKTAPSAGFLADPPSIRRDSVVKCCRGYLPREHPVAARRNLFAVQSVDLFLTI
ncbi:MAG: hypothetical protein ACK49X_01315, partial [Akkermansiaceae bacterium]